MQRAHAAVGVRVHAQSTRAWPRQGNKPHQLRLNRGFFPKFAGKYDFFGYSHLLLKRLSGGCYEIKRWQEVRRAAEASLWCLGQLDVGAYAQSEHAGSEVDEEQEAARSTGDGSRRRKGSVTAQRSSRYVYVSYHKDDRVSIRRGKRASWH